MVLELNRLTDPFLEGVARAFLRRRRALSRGGELVIEADSLGNEEHLVVRFVPIGTQPVLILELLPRNRLSLYLRRSWRKQRGLVLLRIENVRVVDNPAKLLETFEWTILATHAVDALEGSDAQQLDAVANRWRLLALKSV